MVADLTACEFEAKPSNHPSGLVWLDVTIDEETDQYAMTADNAEALAAELIEAAAQARAAAPHTHPEPDPPLPREGYDPKVSWHTDAEM